MPPGIDIALLFVLVVIMSPTGAYFIGVSRTRGHVVKSTSFKKLGRRILAVYYGLLIVTVVCVYSIYYVSGREVGVLQALGCLLFIGGPIIALILIVKGEERRGWKVLPHICHKCGYATSVKDPGLCPECGTRNTPDPHAPM